MTLDPTILPRHKISVEALKASALIVRHIVVLAQTVEPRYFRDQARELEWHFASHIQQAYNAAAAREDGPGSQR